mmetsp:Transcript_68139/g.150947  ORF Transcript_68139/g.150947 Transcript_68139/m.150947 type:complete len:210 (-) Transcript_68139:709-1338(-)
MWHRAGLALYSSAPGRAERPRGRVGRRRQLRLPWRKSAAVPQSVAHRDVATRYQPHRAVETGLSATKGLRRRGTAGFDARHVRHRFRRHRPQPLYAPAGGEPLATRVYRSLWENEGLASIVAPLAAKGPESLGLLKEYPTAGHPGSMPLAAGRVSTGPSLGRGHSTGAAAETCRRVQYLIDAGHLPHFHQSGWCGAESYGRLRGGHLRS